MRIKRKEQVLKFCVTSFTIRLRERDCVMTDAAIFPLEKINHSVGRCPLTYSHEDVWMTNFTAVPDRVFGVGENNIRHALNL